MGATLDSIPYALLLPVAFFLAMAPIHPLPHLVEKLIMLKGGTLIKPLDIFDLAMHSAPLLVLGAKLIRDYVLR